MFVKNKNMNWKYFWESVHDAISELLGIEDFEAFIHYDELENPSDKVESDLKNE